MTLADDAAFEGVNRLAEYAAGPGGKEQLLRAMAEKPDVERWYLPAEEIVRNRLADIEAVHDDGQHQLAAEAGIINALAHEGWLHIEGRPAADGRAIADESVRGAEAAMDRIHDHYQIHSHPFPSAEPSRSVPLPIPARAIVDPALRSALSGQPQPGTKQDRLTHDGARDRRSGSPRDTNQAAGRRGLSQPPGRNR
jgi:hypothetical protein